LLVEIAEGKPQTSYRTTKKRKGLEGLMVKKGWAMGRKQVPQSQGKKSGKLETKNGKKGVPAGEERGREVRV